MFSQPWLRTIALWGAVSLVASAQRGTTQITAATSATSTVTAVKTENAILIRNSHQFNSGVNTDLPGHHQIRIALTNGTTVTVSKDVSSDGDLVSWDLIEFLPGIIRSLQRGTYTTTAAASGTATITAVDTAKATLFDQGFSTTYAVALNGAYWFLQQVLTNSTTITGTCSGIALDRTISYTVVEWN